MSLLDRLRTCAVFTPGNYRPFIIEGERFGLTSHAFADRLAAFPDVFRVGGDAVDLAAGLQTPDARTDAVAQVLEELRTAGHIPGWRGEHYAVSAAFHAAPVMSMERAAVPLFGTVGYGVHLNGYVEKPGGPHMWIGKRAMTKPTGPGKLDQMVGGGQPAGISVADNLIKECGEEAGIGPGLARQARPVGTVSYITERPEGLRHDVLFNYDLRLTADFEPTPTDGEVDAFFLWPVEDVIERIRGTEDFKFNAAMVIIDFAVRHGILGPDDPEYVAVCEALRLGRAGDVSLG